MSYVRDVHEGWRRSGGLGIRINEWRRIDGQFAGREWNKSRKKSKESAGQFTVHIIWQEEGYLVEIGHNEFHKNPCKSDDDDMCTT